MREWQIPSVSNKYRIVGNQSSTHGLSGFILFPPIDEIKVYFDAHIQSGKDQNFIPGRSVVLHRKHHPKRRKEHREDKSQNDGLIFVRVVALPGEGSVLRRLRIHNVKLRAAEQVSDEYKVRRKGEHGHDGSPELA